MLSEFRDLRIFLEQKLLALLILLLSHWSDKILLLLLQKLYLKLKLFMGSLLRLLIRKILLEQFWYLVFKLSVCFL